MADSGERVRGAGWTCFHCGEHFPDTNDGIRSARDHFGCDTEAEPACIMQLGADDRYWLRECCKLLEEVGRYQDEDSALARLMAEQRSQEAARLRSAEETGYARGLRDGRAEDTRRLDWLERRVVNVRDPLVYGSRDLFWASPERDEESPSDLRAQVDRCIAKATDGSGT